MTLAAAHDPDDDRAGYGPPDYDPPDIPGLFTGRPRPADREYAPGAGGVVPPPDETEQETDRERLLRNDRSARLERLIWRNAFLGLYALGLLLYVGWALMREGTGWNLSAFVVLILGALFPGLFLISRESNEREVEWNRTKPEPRTTRELPGLRRPVEADYDPDGYAH